MDIAGTKKKIQRATKIAEESYKKMNEMLERMQEMEQDLATTSSQVDHMEYELAEQRALLKAIAEQQGLDVTEVLDSAELPEKPEAEGSSEETASLAEKATSRPSASGEDSA